jgi:hypothetical protein
MQARKQERQKARSGRERREQETEKKSAQDIRMSINPFQPSNVKSFPFSPSINSSC